MSDISQIVDSKLRLEIDEQIASRPDIAAHFTQLRQQVSAIIKRTLEGQTNVKTANLELDRARQRFEQLKTAPVNDPNQDQELVSPPLRYKSATTGIYLEAPKPIYVEPDEPTNEFDQPEQP